MTGLFFFLFFSSPPSPKEVKSYFKKRGACFLKRSRLLRAWSCQDTTKKQMRLDKAGQSRRIRNSRWEFRMFSKNMPLAFKSPPLLISPPTPLLFWRPFLESQLLSQSANLPCHNRSATELLCLELSKYRLQPCLREFLV